MWYIYDSLYSTTCPRPGHQRHGVTNFIFDPLLPLVSSIQMKNLKILVVDDQEATRRIVTILVKQIGFTDIHEAENGEVAWSLLKASHYDLVLCDLAMPILDGFELLDRIRGDAELGETKFILVTASDSKKEILRAIQAKVDQYIVKPFTKETLREKIYKVLGW